MNGVEKFIDMKLRITILIILTLLLGFVIGMLTSAQLRHKRMRPVRTFASEQYFREHFYRIVEPSEEQKLELDGIIKSYADDFNQLRSQYREGFDSLMDEQWGEVKPVLNKEQIEKLEEFERNRRKAMKDFRDKRSSDDRGRDRYDRDKSRNYHRDSDRENKERSDRDNTDRSYYRDSDREKKDRDDKDRRYYDCN